VSAEGPEKIVFVGGAPRSGTTVTHALICTSTRVNSYTAELSYFRAVPDSYRLGRVAWERHTSSFFESEEAFRVHTREVADLRLRPIWEKLGRPEILALKDPHLTPYFPELAEIYPIEARFLTVVRHPYDVVRSRQEVQQRLSQPFLAGHAQAVAEEYVNYYEAALSSDFGHRHFAFRYEALNKPDLQARIAKFIGVDDLHARPMWGRDPVAQDDPWHSPKYTQPINLEARLGPLDEDLKAVVRSVCGPLMQRMGYADMDFAA